MRLLRSAGLPLPARQARVRREDGSYYLDAEWPAYALGAEIDGAQHDEVLVREYDHQRQNELTLSGRWMLRFSSYAVRHHPQLVVATVERALRSRGW